MSSTLRMAACRCTSLLLICGLVFSGAEPAGAEQKIYWSDGAAFPPRIQKSNIDGSNVETVIEQSVTTGRVVDVEVDAAGGKIYWADFLGKSIRRSDRDGTNVETLVTGLNQPWTIALDLPNNKLYWADMVANNIERINLDGTGRELFLAGIASPKDIALDAVNGKIYWAEHFTGTVSRANLDGTGVEDIITGVFAAWAIELDVANERIYISTGGGPLRRVNFDGTELENVTWYPVGHFKLDVAGGKFYYTGRGTSENTAGVNRANLDGTGGEVIWSTFWKQQTLACGFMGHHTEGLGLDLDSGKVLFSLNFVSIQHAQNYSHGSIQQLNLDGAAFEALVPFPELALCHPYGVAVDTNVGKIYWAEPLGGVARANPDGTGFEMVNTTSSAYDIAVDPRDGKIYWSHQGSSGQIHSANGDGSNHQTFFPPAHSIPAGITLDVVNDKIYYTDVRRGPSLVYRMNLDLSDPQLEVITVPSGYSYSSIAVDPVAEKIYVGVHYWRDSLIYRSNYDGSGLESPPMYMPQTPHEGYLYDIALDVQSGNLVWAAYGRVGRSDLDGLGAEILDLDITAHGLSIGVALVDDSPADGDGDGVPDDQDICPGGDDNVNTDGDLAPDFCDVCPIDPDNDADGDGICGDIDVCPVISDDQTDTDGDFLGDACDVCPLDSDNDVDGDGVCGEIDNCPIVANANQANTDGDLEGNACDFDDDSDGICDIGPAVAGICTAGPDNCPLDVNGDQADFDGDGDGDVCDNDLDNDGVVGGADACPMTSSGEVINADGCSISDLSPCENESKWKNHGAYVRSVAHASEDFVNAGLITEAEKDVIVSMAGASSCGAKK